MELKLLVLTVVMIYMVAAEDELQKTPTVELEAGALRGVVKPDGLRGYYHAYMGIPYAKVEKRFKEAIPVTQWDGIFEANDDSVRCYQANNPAFYLVQPNTYINNKEDCLTLNVYTPVPQAASALKPVMVFIHGGGFIFGASSSRIYGPEYFLRNDVILVTINYRLDIFGYLCLGINEAPGNAGFKDQVEALRWIKKNILAFGGDPDNVTLFGESAGAVSTTLHLVSPMSQGLFHKIIAQSGSSISPWSVKHDQIMFASQVASLMGYSTQDPYELYNIFTNASADDLLQYRLPRRHGDIIIGEFSFGACVENELEGVERFLTDLPYNLLVSGQYAKVPMILGHDSNEGYIFAAFEHPATFGNITVFNSLPTDLVFPNEVETEATANKLEELYFSGYPISKDTLIQLSNYEGDSQITYSMIASADIIMRTSDLPVYVYNFAYSGYLNLAKFSAGFKAVPGATHGDELFYMFKHSLAGVNEVVESGMILKICSLWTNFAKYSDPVPIEIPLLPLKWQPITEGNQNEFIIDSTFSTSPMWSSERLLYWNQTYAQYRRTF